MNSRVSNFAHKSIILFLFKILVLERTRHILIKKRDGRQRQSINFNNSSVFSSILRSNFE